MELTTYLSIVWRRKWIIVISIIVTTIVATVATLLSTPTYVASTTVRVATFGSGAAENTRTDINYSQLLMSTYSRILTSGSVRGEIQQELGLETFPQLTAELVPNTELMRINAEATNPESAQQIANKAAEILIAKSQELYSGGGQTAQEILKAQIDQIKLELDDARIEYDNLLADSPDDVASISAASQSIALKEKTYTTLLEQYEIVRVNEALRANAVSVVEPAFQPRTPAKPRHEINIALGAIVGLLGGIVLAFIFDNFDTTLYSSRQIEGVTKLPAIGKIPETNGPMQIVQIGTSYQPELEAFRRLRTNILVSNGEESGKILMVTSADRGEGKSTITANLAVSIAQSGRRVAIVDCDMRIPMQHELFEQPNKRGLSDVLANSSELKDTLQDTVYTRVQLLTSGTLPPNPSELLGSSQMKALLENLKEDFDIVLLDTPALLSVSDAAVLASLADRVLLVVARSRSRKDAIYAVRQQLRYVNTKELDLVVNLSEANRSYRY
jgi:succinoglycan biosynthesis transport protein ExoP